MVTKEMVELNNNVDAYFKLNKQKKKIEETLKNIKLDIVDTFSSLAIDKWSTSKHNATLRNDEIKLIDSEKYYKLVTRKDFYESVKVINTKAFKLVPDERLDKIITVSTKEVLTVK